MRKDIVAATISTILVDPASAHYSLKSCEEWNIGLEALVQPVADNQLVLYEGKVVVYNIDTIEPAAASAGIAVVIPDTDDPLGGSKCVALTGIGAIDVKKAQRHYDAARGLLLTIPAQKSNDTGELTPDAPVRMRINLQKSTVEIE